MLRAGGFPNCSTLAKSIEVTPKTIQRDISFMRDQLDLPLEYDSIKHGYYYTREVREFPMLHLSRRDIVALFLARHALEPLRGTRLERMLSASFSKIAEACPGEVSIHWHELDRAFSVKATGVLAADVVLFSDLLDAIMSRLEISFDYRKLGATQSERRMVRPYHVGQIEHGWYLLGYDVRRKALRTFALQRISSLEAHETTFEPDPAFNAAEHFGNGFGVWSYEETKGALHQVAIRFDGYAARFVAERRWHPSQEIRNLNKDGSAIEFQVALPGLEEITRWVLSWGSKARVLAPAELEQRVKAELAAALAKS